MSLDEALTWKFRREKKIQLASIHYPNILYASRLNQLRYMINLKYGNFNSGMEPISEEAWRELLLDLVRDDRMLVIQLISILIDFKKDIKAACFFLQVFGLDFLKGNYKLSLIKHSSIQIELYFSNL